MMTEQFDTPDIDESKVFPSVMRRVQALFVDFWIIIGLVALFDKAMLSGWEGHLIGLKIILFFIIAFVYDPMLSITGGTIGQRTMGMKIRCFDDPHKKINFAQAYFRSFMKILLGWISFLSVSIDPFRRAMHDKASNTVVLESRI